MTACTVQHGMNHHMTLLRVLLWKDMVACENSSEGQTRFKTLKGKPNMVLTGVTRLVPVF